MEGQKQTPNVVGRGILHMFGVSRTAMLIFVNACVCEASNTRREETTGQGADNLAPEKPQCGEAKLATPEQESIAAASEREAQEIEVITIFVTLGLFRHFETVKNIRTWIKSHKYWRML